MTTETKTTMTDKVFLQILQSRLNNLILETPTSEFRNILCDLHNDVMAHNASFAKTEEVSTEGQRLCPNCQLPLKNPEATKHFRCPAPTA